MWSFACDAWNAVLSKVTEPTTKSQPDSTPFRSRNARYKRLAHRVDDILTRKPWQETNLTEQQALGKAMHDACCDYAALPAVEGETDKMDHILWLTAQDLLLRRMIKRAESSGDVDAQKRLVQTHKTWQKQICEQDTSDALFKGFEHHIIRHSWLELNEATLAAYRFNTDPSINLFPITDEQRETAVNDLLKDSSGLHTLLSQEMREMLRGIIPLLAPEQALTTLTELSRIITRQWKRLSAPIAKKERTTQAYQHYTNKVAGIQDWLTDQIEATKATVKKTKKVETSSWSMPSMPSWASVTSHAASATKATIKVTKAVASYAARNPVKVIIGGLYAQSQDVFGQRMPHTQLPDRTVNVGQYDSFTVQEFYPLAGQPGTPEDGKWYVINPPKNSALVGQYEFCDYWRPDFETNEDGIRYEVRSGIPSRAQRGWCTFSEEVEVFICDVPTFDTTDAETCPKSPAGSFSYIDLFTPNTAPEVTNPSGNPPSIFLPVGPINPEDARPFEEPTCFPNADPPDPDCDETTCKETDKACVIDLEDWGNLKYEVVSVRHPVTGEEMSLAEAFGGSVNVDEKTGALVGTMGEGRQTDLIGPYLVTYRITDITDLYPTGNYPQDVELGETIAQALVHVPNRGPIRTGLNPNVVDVFESFKAQSVPFPPADYASDADAGDVSLFTWQPYGVWQPNGTTALNDTIPGGDGQVYLYQLAPSKLRAQGNTLVYKPSPEDRPGLECVARICDPFYACVDTLPFTLPVTNLAEDVSDAYSTVEGRVGQTRTTFAQAVPSPEGDGFRWTSVHVPQPQPFELDVAKKDAAGEIDIAWGLGLPTVQSVTVCGEDVPDNPAVPPTAACTSFDVRNINVTPQRIQAAQGRPLTFPAFGQEVSGSIADWYEDPNGRALSYAFDNLPPGITGNSDGSFSGTMGAVPELKGDIFVTVTDEDGGVLRNDRIPWSMPNTAPTAVSTYGRENPVSVDIIPDGSTVVSGVAAVTDVNGQTSTWAVDPGNSIDASIPNPSKPDMRLSPQDGDQGVRCVEVTATDADNAASEPVKVCVDVQDAPLIKTPDGVRVNGQGIALGHALPTVPEGAILSYPRSVSEGSAHSNPVTVDLNGLWDNPDVPDTTVDGTSYTTEIVTPVAGITLDGRPGQNTLTYAPLSEHHLALNEIIPVTVRAHQIHGGGDSKFTEQTLYFKHDNTAPNLEVASNTDVPFGDERVVTINMTDQEGDGASMSITEGFDPTRIRSGESVSIICRGDIPGVTAYTVFADDGFGGMSQRTFTCSVPTPPVIDTPASTPWSGIITALVIGIIGIPASAIGACLCRKGRADTQIHNHLETLAKQVKNLELKAFLGNESPRAPGKTHTPSKNFQQQAQEKAHVLITSSGRTYSTFIATAILPLIPNFLAHSPPVEVIVETHVGESKTQPPGGSPKTTPPINTGDIPSPPMELIEAIQWLRYSGLDYVLITDRNTLSAQLLGVCQHMSHRIQKLTSALAVTPYTLIQAERDLILFLQYQKLWQSIQDNKPSYAHTNAQGIVKHVLDLMDDLVESDPRYTVEIARFEKLFGMLHHLVQQLHSTDWHKSAAGTQGYTMQRQAKTELIARVLKHCEKLKKFTLQDSKKTLHIQTYRHVEQRQRALLTLEMARQGLNAIPETNPANTWRTCGWLCVHTVSRNIARLREMGIYLTRFKPSPAAPLLLLSAHKAILRDNISVLSEYVKNNPDSLTLYHCVQALKGLLNSDSVSLESKRNLALFFIDLFNAKPKGHYSAISQRLLRLDIRNELKPFVIKQLTILNNVSSHYAAKRDAIRQLALVLERQQPGMLSEHRSLLDIKTQLTTCINTAKTALNQPTCTENKFITLKLLGNLSKALPTYLTSDQHKKIDTAIGNTIKALYETLNNASSNREQKGIALAGIIWALKSIPKKLDSYQLTELKTCLTRLNPKQALTKELFTEAARYLPESRSERSAIPVIRIGNYIKKLCGTNAALSITRQTSRSRSLPRLYKPKSCCSIFSCSTRESRPTTRVHTRPVPRQDSTGIWMNNPMRSNQARPVRDW